MSYLAEELGENATNGVRNQVSDVKLLQGDIAEAWRENGQEYATLAMRYSSIDAMVERASGRVVSGDDRRPSESPLAAHRRQAAIHQIMSSSTMSPIFVKALSRAPARWAERMKPLSLRTG